MSKLNPLVRLRQLIWLERQDLWTVMAYGVGAGLMSLATPIAVQSLVNTIAFGALLQPLVVLVVILLASLGFKNLLVGFQYFVVEMMQRRIFVRLLGDVSKRLQRVSSEAFDGRNGPELVNRFFDVLTVQKTAAVLLLDGLAYVLQTVIGMLLLGFYHPVLLTFDLVLIVAVFFILIGMGQGGVATAIEESRAKYSVAAWLEELARNPVAFKWAGTEEFVARHSDVLARDYLAAREAHFGVVMRQNIGALSLHAVANTALLGLGGWMVIDRQLTLGQLIAAELVVSAMLYGLNRLGKSLENFYDLLAAIDKLGYLLDLPQERSGGTTMSHTGKAVAVQLRAVTYRYAGALQPVLVDIDMIAEPGERIALTGRSGAGKGTLLELLFGVRMPSSGSVRVDGLDLRDIDLGSLRQEIALVRGSEILEDTLINNIRMGRTEVGIEEVTRALADLRLLDHALALPEGLNTPLSYLGDPLSPEQTRRLLLARAVVGRPRLLLIEEILDTVDADVREPVMSFLLGESAPWTAIVATQSADVIAACGSVWRLEEGRLARSLRAVDVADA